MDEHVSMTLALVAVLGMAAQWIAWRWRLPAIVVLAAAGLIAGPGLGWLDPERDFGPLVRPFVGLAVGVILFEGGLRLKLHDLREASAGVARLCSVGLLFNWTLGSIAAHWIGGLSWPVSLTFGAILTVTGPTVIVPLLRQARLDRRIAALFKWEGIVNDPLGALLAVLTVEFFVIAEQTSLPGTIGRLTLALLVATVLGLVAGRLLGHVFQHGLVAEFLKAPILLAAVLAVYVLGNEVVHEAGLLATTAMGFVISNMKLASIGELTRFKDSIVVVLVSGVFVVLTADIDLADLSALDVRAAALLASVLFLVRPIAILLATWGAGLASNERLLLAWIAPRGIVAAAVAGVAGPRLVDAGYADGTQLAPLVFGVVFATVVAHGFSLPWLARHLGLSSGARDGLLIVGASRWTTALGRTLADLEIPVVVADTSWARLRRPRLAGLPVSNTEVLSEHGEETLPFHQISAVLAATHNDAYNALVCVHFGPELGRDRVFQLAQDEGVDDDSREHHLGLQGRVLMGERMGYDALQTRSALGWTFQKTRLTEEYDFEAFLNHRDEETQIVLLLRENGRLVLHAARFGVEPKAGDIVVSYGPAPESAPDEADVDATRYAEQAPADGEDASDSEESGDDASASS